MEKFNRNYILKLASDLMFELTMDEVIQVESDSMDFMEQIRELQEIDTESVEMMSYPFETLRTSLRDDVVSHVITQEVAFKNAPKIEGDYFEIVQVVEK